MEVTPIYESYPYIWKLPLYMEVTPVYGSYPYVWKLLLYMEVTHIYGSYTYIWNLPLHMEVKTYLEKSGGQTLNFWAMSLYQMYGALNIKSFHNFPIKRLVYFDHSSIHPTFNNVFSDKICLNVLTACLPLLKVQEKNTAEEPSSTMEEEGIFRGMSRTSRNFYATVARNWAI